MGKRKKQGRRSDIASRAVITITSEAGSDAANVRVEFDPPIAGPANKDQRTTVAQEVATAMLDQFADQIIAATRASDWRASS